MSDESRIKGDKVLLKYLLIFECILVLVLMWHSVRGQPELCKEWNPSFITTCYTSHGSSYECIDKTCKVWEKNAEYRDWLLRKVR